MTYGTVVTRKGTDSCRDLIGDIGTTHAGNVYLRIGRENKPDGSWHQIGYIVLTPDEANKLGEELCAKSSSLRQGLGHD